MKRQSGSAAMISSLRDGVIIFNAKKQVTLTNPAMRQLTGLSGSEYDIESLVGLLTGVDLGKMLREVHESQTATHVSEVPVGDSIFEIFVTPLVDTKGNFEGGAIVLHDITDIRKIDEIRRDFMNVAAHDLRTPMTAVKGFVQMIRQGDFGEPPGGEIAQALSDVEDGADRMISLVNDFLTVSRIEQGRFKVNVQPIDIGPTVQHAVDEISVTVQSKLIEISHIIDPDVPKVMADKSKISQVLVNLMDNALKHTEKGKITIAVERDENPEFVLVTETNTGDSIPVEELPHIFERYYQGKQIEVASGRGGGLGLGLHIVKMIVEAHGGKIWVENGSSGGVAFHFTLPVAGK